MSTPKYYRLLNEGEAIEKGDDVYHPRTSEWEAVISWIGFRASERHFPIRREVQIPQWIPLEERKPTLEDGDDTGLVIFLDDRNQVWFSEYQAHREFVAWMPISSLPKYEPKADKEFEEWFEVVCTNFELDRKNEYVRQKAKAAYKALKK